MKETQIKKYIELVYSQDSELSKIEDLNQRKKTAIEKVNANITTPDVQDVIHLRNKNINEMIFSFMKENNSNKYALLNSRRQLFWELQERLMKPLTSSYKANDKDVDIDDEALLKSVNLKTTISDKAEVLLEGIDRLYKQIFIGEEEIEMATTMMKIITPEQRLKKKSA